jgi:hypothetical protein
MDPIFRTGIKHAAFFQDELGLKIKYLAGWNWATRKTLKLASIKLQLHVEPIPIQDGNSESLQISVMQCLPSGISLHERVVLDEEVREVHDDHFGALLCSAKLVDGTRVVARKDVVCLVEEFVRSVNYGFFSQSSWALEIGEQRKCLTRRIEITNGRATVRRQLVYNSDI